MEISGAGRSGMSPAGAVGAIWRSFDAPVPQGDQAVDEEMLKPFEIVCFRRPARPPPDLHPM
jgi:hypothetical protein